MSPTTARKRLSREESQAQTRERLIDTAQQLFVANGYGGASIRDIANKAGYSQGAFYSNFASKEDVLLELLRRHMTAEATHLSRVMSGDGDDSEQIFAELDAWAGRLKAWAAGGAPEDLPRVDPDHTAAKTPRDVFAFIIHEGKVRAPAGAMALIERVKE